MLFSSSLRALHCPIYDLDNLDACALHAVLWDVHAHAHYPLIEETLMHMHIVVVYHHLPNTFLIILLYTLFIYILVLGEVHLPSLDYLLGEKYDIFEVGFSLCLYM